VDQLIEVLKQIQDLSGVALHALTEAKGGQHGAPEGGAQPHPGGAPEGSPQEERSESPQEAEREGDNDRGGNRPQFGRRY
jgi:hypothetical protein